MDRVFLPIAALLLGASVHAGSLYVPNHYYDDSGLTAHGRITEFDAATGQFRRHTVEIAGSLVAGLTFGPDRLLYMSLWDPVQNRNGRITVCTRQGTDRRVLIRTGTGGLEFPLGVRFGPNGYLYVANNSPNVDKVLKFNRFGQFLATVASNLVTPQEILFAPDGALVVSNGQADSIYEFDPVRNRFVSAFVPTGTGGLDGPIGMTIGPDHNLYVASTFQNAVLRFNGSTGAFVDVFASFDGFGDAGPTDLAFGPDGSLYVLANLNSTPGGEVVRFDGASGQFMDIFVAGASAGLIARGNTGMLFVDPGCSRYGDYGFANRCFTPAPVQ